MKEFIVYTDGAYKSSTKQGGIGIVFVCDNHIVYKYDKSILNTTNNRCELIAVIKVLQSISKPIKSLTIYSDSQYVINSINEGWQRKKNRDLWNIFDRFYQKAQKYCNNITFKWVKGHENNDTDQSKYNNLADSLAVKASNEFIKYEVQETIGIPTGKTSVV